MKEEKGKQMELSSQSDEDPMCFNGTKKAWLQCHSTGKGELVCLENEKSIIRLVFR